MKKNLRKQKTCFLGFFRILSELFVSFFGKVEKPEAWFKVCLSLLLCFCFKLLLQWKQAKGGKKTLFSFLSLFALKMLPCFNILTGSGKIHNSFLCLWIQYVCQNKQEKGQPSQSVFRTVLFFLIFYRRKLKSIFRTFKAQRNQKMSFQNFFCKII